MSKNIGCFILILLELIGMRSKVLINDGIETSIPCRAIHPSPADYALILLAYHQLSQTGPAESVVAGLNAYGEDHDLEAVATGYLLF
jgi:hypothetical protein